MPFIPDNSVPALKKQDRFKILLDNARKQEVITKQEAAKAKKDSGFAETIVRLTGMGKTADTFAKYGANKMSSSEAKQFAPMPTRGEMAGAIGQTALMAYPGTTVAKGVAGVASKFMGAGASKLAGSVASLGGAGYGFDVSKNLEEGKTGMSAAKPGVGAALGAIPVVGAAASKAKSGIQKIGANQAPRIINSLIKPLQKDFAYGKNPGRAVAGIKADNFDDLVTKISQSRQKAGQVIGDLGKKLEGKVVLSLQDTLLPINDAMETAAKQNNATLLQRLASVKRSITENLKKGLDEAGNPTIVSDGLRNLETATFQEARDIMRAIGDVTAFTGNPSDDKLVNSALKRVYGQMKGKTLEAAEKADPAIAKLFRQATERYGDLTSAEIAAKYRDKILERQNITSFGQTTIGLGGALATAIATGGAAVPTILAGLGAAGLQKALGSTAFKTRLAAWLSKIPTEEKTGILQKFPQLNQIMDTRTPGDMFLDTNLGKKLKEGIKNMKGKGGLNLNDVSGGKAGYTDDLLQEARKYKTTVNLQDENDVDYLRRIFSDDIVNEIKSGKTTNWRGENYSDIARVNFASEVPQTVEQKLAGKIKDAKLNSDTFYHGTSSGSADSIMASGFKPGSKLLANAYRGGGYGKTQSTVSFAETPKEAGIFSTLTKDGKIVEAKLKPNARVVSIDGIEDAVDLEDYIGYLRKQKIDAVYIGGGEKELVVINPKAATPIKSQLTDLYNQATKGTKRGFGTGAGRVKGITKAQDTKVTRSSLMETLETGVRQHIKNLENAKKIDFDAISKYQDLLKRVPKITDIQSLTRNIAELERKGKLKLMDEAVKIRNEAFQTLLKK